MRTSPCGRRRDAGVSHEEEVKRESTILNRKVRGARRRRRKKCKGKIIKEYAKSAKTKDRWKN